MRIKLLKPSLHNDAMYGPDSIVDLTDEGRANFFVKMGHAEAVPPDTPLSRHVDPPRPVRSHQATEIGEAIVEAIKKGDKTREAELRKEEEKLHKEEARKDPHVTTTQKPHEKP